MRFVLVTAMLAVTATLVGCGGGSAEETVTQREAHREKGGSPGVAREKEKPQAPSAKKVRDPAGKPKRQKGEEDPSTKPQEKKGEPTAKTTGLPDEIVNPLPGKKPNEPLTRADLKRLTDQVEAERRKIQKTLEAAAP